MRHASRFDPAAALITALVVTSVFGAGVFCPAKGSPRGPGIGAAVLPAPPAARSVTPPAGRALRLLPIHLTLGDAFAGLSDLELAIAKLQSLLNSVETWVQSTAAAARGAVLDIIAAPTYMSGQTELAGLMGRVLDLPDDLRQRLTTMLSQWWSATPHGPLAGTHEAYVTATPVLTQAAAGVATSAAVVAAGSVRQDAGVEASAETARTVASDPRLNEVAAAARQAGNTMVQEAADLPSSRAGIEMLVAGMGAGMEQQADAAVSLGDRLTALVQEIAAVSQQVGALGEVTSALTARDAERDRRSFDAQLGLMDALHAGGQTLARMLSDADESADVGPNLTPLY